MICTGYAKLSAEQVKKVRELEEKFEVTLLAYEKPAIAHLEEADLARIRNLEQELGLALVAYAV